MELQEHEVICDKCHGDPMIDEEGHISILCERCGGTGKLDWVDKAMAGAKKVATPMFLNSMDPPSDITFYAKDQEEMLKITKDGFYVKGKKISDDKKVYSAFVKFLQEAGTY